MRIVLQRVQRASVTCHLQGGETVEAAIGLGYLALVGVAHDDSLEVAVAQAKRVAGIRLFPNLESPEAKPIDRPLADVDGAVLAVSQFTLQADTSRGRRPSFVRAAPGDVAEPIFNEFVRSLRAQDITVETGCFGAHMEVSLVNDGPVTIVLES